MAIRVLIADDQTMVRAGFRMILELEDDIEVIAEAEDGAAAVRGATARRPDVVVMDIRMPGVDGIEATRRILAEHASPPGIVMVTTFDDDETLYEALRAGAGGFLLKNAPPEQLVDAVRTVAGGEAPALHPASRAACSQQFARRAPAVAPPPPSLDELTQRETRGPAPHGARVDQRRDRGDAGRSRQARRRRTSDAC